LANPHEPAWQDVLDKAAQKLQGGEPHRAGLMAVGVILPLKGDVLAIEGEQAVIADRDPVGVERTETATSRLNGIRQSELSRARRDVPTYSRLPLLTACGAAGGLRLIEPMPAQFLRPPCTAPIGTTASTARRSAAI
jgi:hypothetical protein